MIVVINAGSSSVKVSLYQQHPLSCVASGLVQLRDGRIIAEGSRVDGSAIDASECILGGDQSPTSALLQQAVITVNQLGVGSPSAVVHRVVHGGSAWTDPVVVTPECRAALGALSDLAPLHQPVNLAGIDAFATQYPDSVQVACFDTAFHHHQDPLETHFALPKALYDQGVRKYGFHGLSYAYVTQQFPNLGIDSSARVVCCHLGNGASMCAIRDGRSVASTMGFTALDGLPMGTRSGRLDPGVILHLMDHKGMTLSEIEHLLYHECGLKGLSGLSSDVRTLEAAGTLESDFALDYFAYRINAEMGSLVAILGGLDAIIFTGGIGEHSCVVRAKVVARLSAWLPVALCKAANQANQDRLDADTSRIQIHRVATDENRFMADAALGMLQGHD